jgi:glucosamine-6-phosphate deaminase
MDLLSLMTIPRDELGRGTNVRVRLGGDSDDLARLMADEMAGLIEANNRAGKPTTMIIPVGPVGQYPILADRIARGGIDCAGVSFLMMDEFLGDDGGPIDLDHPLSFRGFLLREFLTRLPPAARFNPDNWLCPDPEQPEAVEEWVEARGGVDVCFGGIGLNGHLAFNEPEDVDPDEFAGRPARVVEVAPASRAHMAVNLSCALDLIPGRAVTVGMREILGSRRISLYANRPWQGGVVRLALHGPVSARCPASLVRRYPDVTLTVADVVAEPREVRLR